MGAVPTSVTTSVSTPTRTSPLSLPNGPITRARAKKFKDALHGLIRDHEEPLTHMDNAGKSSTKLVHLIGCVEDDDSPFGTTMGTQGSPRATQGVPWPLMACP